MKIGIAAFTHESNTFAVSPTTLSDFTIHHGDDLVDHYRPTFHEVAGFIAGADEFDFTLSPLLTANATTPYALSFINLDETGPIVVEMPEAEAQRVIGMRYEAWIDEQLVDPPVFNHPGGPVVAGFQLTVTGPEAQ